MAGQSVLNKGEKMFKKFIINLFIFVGLISTCYAVDPPTTEQEQLRQSANSKWNNMNSYHMSAASAKGQCEYSYTTAMTWHDKCINEKHATELQLKSGNDLISAGIPMQCNADATYMDDDAFNAAVTAGSSLENGNTDWTWLRYSDACIDYNISIPNSDFALPYWTGAYTTYNAAKAKYYAAQSFYMNWYYSH